MLYSMTGFGRSTVEYADKKITVEIKSLNSKQFDFNARIPSAYRSLEVEMRNELVSVLQRGKVDLSVTVDSLGGGTASHLNAAVVGAYARQIEQTAREAGIAMPADIWTVIVRFPDVNVQEPVTEVGDEERKAILAVVREAAEALMQYRRFIQMYGNVAMGVDHDKFEEIIDEVKSHRGITQDTDLTTEELQEIVSKYKAMYKKEKGEDFPQDPHKQMWGAIGAVFGSWMNPRAITYRKLNNIDERVIKGTAVTVMAMVFGNMGDTSGTGVCFSRDPSTGVNEFMGEYLMNAQGEDVVAGIRTPQHLSQLAETNPKIYDQLCKIRARLEKHYHDMQDMEFTVQEGTLYMLQCRNGKRTGPAAVKMAVDMVAEKLITKEQALLRVKPDQLDQLLHPQFEPKALKAAAPIAEALNASPGAGAGQIVFTADEAVEWNKAGKKVMLVRKETSPDDIAGMYVAEGILTSTGGRTSHAAVVARGMGTP